MSYSYGYCYECDSQQKLVYQSRCVQCVIRRLEFNLIENDKLRAENEALRVKLELLLDFAQTVGGSSSFWDEVWEQEPQA